MISDRILLSKVWDFGGVLYFHLFPLKSFHYKESSTPEKNERTKIKATPASQPNSLSSSIFLLHFALKKKKKKKLGIMTIATESQFHVLAVDDSLIDRKLIERLLRTSSYQVTTVDSGSKALEFLGLLQDEQANSPSPSPSPPPEQNVIEVNLVITDYCMPGMTGYDLLKKIKESQSLKDIPVVIMSSENVPARINRCLEEGAEEFLLKPVKSSDMNRLRPHILKGKNKDQQQQQQAQQQPNNISSGNSSSNNKRKAMDGGLSPESTRPRFSNNTSSLTVL